MKILFCLLLCLIIAGGCLETNPISTTVTDDQSSKTEIESMPVVAIKQSESVTLSDEITETPYQVSKPNQTSVSTVKQTIDSSPTAKPTETSVITANPTSASEPTVKPTGMPDPTAIAETTTADVLANVKLDLSQLWSYNLTSIRTGEPIIKEGGEHNLDPGIIAYGYNMVADASGTILTPRGAPLQGGEQLLQTAAYQDDYNTREYARIFSIMAPIRDTILYHYEETTVDEWKAVTNILTINRIKTENAAEISNRSILSTGQVYDFIAGGQASGSPVMRYLEEAELELKCLAFKDFNFTNPEGGNHCREQKMEVGYGIQLP